MINKFHSKLSNIPFLSKLFILFSDRRFQFIIGILFLLLAFSIPVKSDTNIIYDNITVSQYKFITLSELNIIPLLPDYKYKVLINNNFVGFYGKDENIFYPDNSNITVIIPSEFLTSTDNIYTTSIRPMAFNMIGFLLTWGVLIIIVCVGLFYLQRKIRKGY
jgi:hypothetical protein